MHRLDWMMNRRQIGIFEMLMKHCNKEIFEQKNPS
jgi:hypothetical protein